MTVQLSGPAHVLPVSVDFATADGTATAGSDYTAASGTLTFAPGETSRTITVPIQGDVDDEPDEGLAVRLFGQSAGSAIGDGDGVFAIADDDLPLDTAVTGAKAKISSLTLDSLIKKGRVKVRASLGEGGKVTVKGSVRPLAVLRSGAILRLKGGSASFTAAGTKTVTLKLSSKNRKKLRNRRTARLSITFTARDLAGNNRPGTTVKKTIKRRASKR